MSKDCGWSDSKTDVLGSMNDALEDEIEEMQEKLDAAIEIIRFYADKNNWLSSVASGKRARDFLKSRGGR